MPDILALTDKHHNAGKNALQGIYLIFSLNKAFTMCCHFFKLKMNASSKCNFNAQVFSIHDFEVQIN